MLFYDEVFHSIQGEGTDAGRMCVFVRLFGCNIGCSYCDQPQTVKKNKHKISIENLLTLIRREGKGIKYVCITGGEPLLQEDVYTLIYGLVGIGYEVSVETSGCVPIEADNYARSFKYVMDIKCPSSGASSRNIFDNLSVLKVKDEVKFVVKDRKDYEFAKRILGRFPTKAKILFSPVFVNNKPVIGSELVNWIYEDKLNARVQIQMHKVLEVR